MGSTTPTVAMASVRFLAKKARKENHMLVIVCRMGEIYSSPYNTEVLLSRAALLLPGHCTLYKISQVC